MLRIGFLAVFAGFLAVSLLLLTAHPGRAMELTGYLFFVILALVLKGILSDETH